MATEKDNMDLKDKINPNIVPDLSRVDHRQVLDRIDEKVSAGLGEIGRLRKIERTRKF